MNLAFRPHQRRGTGRIKPLDGLRGVAIMLVIMFHAYYGWAQAVPFGDRFADVLLFKYGFLGVQLFFLISGFVIFMTLEQCGSFGEFITRRWLRLFPAMLFVSLLVFFSAPYLPERPAGEPVARDLLPGLTFMQPVLWGLLFGSPQGVVEGSYWSLFVEAKFYVLFGALYFWRRDRAIGGLILIFLFSTADYYLSLAGWLPDNHFSKRLADFLELISAKYFGWFAAGALYYQYFREKKRRLLLYAVLMAVFTAATLQVTDDGARIAALLVVLLFSLGVASSKAGKILTNPVLLFVGFISYPLYLIHENMMVALIIRMGRMAPGISPILLPLVPIATVICLATIIAIYIEPLIRSRLRALPSRLCAFQGRLQGPRRKTAGKP